jgi:hypothetical protein
MAMEGRTQSLWPAAMTMTGKTKEAISSMMVATVTDRSMALASGLVGLRPVPALTRMA